MLFLKRWTNKATIYRRFEIAKMQWPSYLNSVDGKRKFKEKGRGFLPEKCPQGPMGNVGRWYSFPTVYVFISMIQPVKPTII